MTADGKRIAEEPSARSSFLVFVPSVCMPDRWQVVSCWVLSGWPQ